MGLSQDSNIVCTFVIDGSGTQDIPLVLSTHAGIRRERGQEAHKATTMAWSPVVATGMTPGSSTALFVAAALPVAGPEADRVADTMLEAPSSP